MVRSDGSQLTELLVRCLNEEKGHSEGWQSLVEVELLNNINDVFSPDLKFTRLQVKVGVNEGWELYLEEGDKGAIKLSDCGSGLKTVILVMAMLYVVPKFRKGRKFIFIFEELENNLHPSLERKLLAHIRDYIKENSDNLLFLTTHSNIAIDMFSKDENAQILRAYNDGEASFVERMNTWNDHNNLLNDLGVKASDVLQSNCLVWLEGPSDRVYFNKWIELFNDGESLEEGLHYQCVFYGGAMLSHYSASDEDDGFIKMLRINRNGIIMMDSDKSNNSDELKARVQRVIGEGDSVDTLLTWVTEGREIENYLPQAVLNEYFGEDVSLQKFDIFANKYKRTKGVQSFDKVTFASKAIDLPSYTKEAVQEHLDIASQIVNVIAHIRECNSVS